MLRHRNPNLWSTLRKPGGLAWAERDPAALLGRGLAQALIFEGPLSLGMALDYAAPERSFTSTTGGNAPVFTPGLYGAMVNMQFSATTTFAFTPTIASPGANFSFDLLVLTDGSAHGGFQNVLWSQGTTATEYCMVTGATGTLALGNPGVVGVNSTGVNMAGLTGWHRIGGTCNGTAARFFLDGKFTDAQTMSGTLALGAVSDFMSATKPPGNSSWGWSVADAFFWTRTLADSEMQAHAFNPYASVLRPRHPLHQRGTVIRPPFIQVSQPRLTRTEMVPY